MNPFEKKSIFLWNVPAVAGGDATKIAELLISAGIQSVWVKAAQGASTFYSGVQWPALMRQLLNRPNVNRAFVDTMHAAGIAVAGWSYNVAGGDAEGRKAADLVNALGLDGWLWDWEKDSLSVASLGQTLGTFRKTAHVPTGFCWWQWAWARTTGSQIHPPEIARFGMSICDYGVPMFYWSRLDANGKPLVMSDATVQNDLELVLSQWKKLTDKPVIVAGRAYTGDGNVVKASNVAAFGAKAIADLKLPGISWWSLEHAVKIPDVWAEIVRTPSPVQDTTPPPPPDIPEQYPPVIGVVGIDPEPTVLTLISLDVSLADGQKIPYVIHYAPKVTPPPPPPPAAALYRIKDDLQAGIVPSGTRPYLRNGTACTVRMQGVNASVIVPPTWINWLKLVNTTRGYTYLFNRDSGWHNGPASPVGESLRVETVLMGGNVIEVTRIDGNRAYFKCVHPSDTPPAKIIPAPMSNPLIHSFAIQYATHLDYDINGRTPLILPMVPDGQEPWIDVRELIKL